mgnify:CR=1 FL=1
MLARAIRAARFDGEVYKDIGGEPESIFQALGIVILAALAFGLGIRSEPIQGLEESATFVMLVAIATIMVGWVLWASVAYWIGTGLLGGQADHRILLRSVGIAYGPGVLMAMSGVPAVGPAFFSISLLWLLATVTVAVRETQSFGVGRAFLCTIIGWFLALWLLRFFLLQPA